jgi:hypothetical protein
MTVVNSVILWSITPSGSGFVHIMMLLNGECDMLLAKQIAYLPVNMAHEIYM